MSVHCCLHIPHTPLPMFGRLHIPRTPLRMFGRLHIPCTPLDRAHIAAIRILRPCLACAHSCGGVACSNTCPVPLMLWCWLFLYTRHALGVGCSYTHFMPSVLAVLIYTSCPRCCGVPDALHVLRPQSDGHPCRACRPAHTEVCRYSICMTILQVQYRRLQVQDSHT